MVNIWTKELNFGNNTINAATKLETRLGFKVKFLGYDRNCNKYFVRVLRGYNMDYEMKINLDGSRYNADSTHFEDVFIVDEAEAA